MDKIEELKKLLWILDSKYNASIPQTKKNIDYIADEIVKLFCQPAVISSFCHHNGTYTTVIDSNGNEVCCKCRKPLAK